MLYFRVYQMDKSNVSGKKLVPTFKSEFEYVDSQQMYDTIARAYYWYVDINDVSHQLLQFEYKHVFHCHWIDTSDRVQFDVLAVDIVAYE